MKHDKSLTPRDTAERLRNMANLWCKILRLNKVRPDDDFFELGGDSAHALQLSMELSDMTGKDIPNTAVYQASTVRLLVNYCDSLDSNFAPRETELVESSKEMLPIAPQHQEFLDRDFIDEEESNCRILIRLVTGVDLFRLREAVETVIDRSEIFRFRVVISSGQYFFRYENDLALDISGFEDCQLASLPVGADEKLNFFNRYVGPLDPLKDPLISAKYLVTSFGAVLLVKASHLILDGFATTLFLRQVANAYLNDDENPSLRAQQRQFTYSNFLSRVAKASESSRQYWEEYLLGKCKPSFLSGIDRNGVRSYARIGTLLRKELVTKSVMRGICQRTNSTELSILLALYFIAIRGHSAANQICISSTISGRHLPEYNELLGSLSSHVLFTVNVDTTRTLSSLFHEISQDTANAFRNLNISRSNIDEYSRREDLVNFTMIPAQFLSGSGTLRSVFNTPDLLARPVKTPYDISTRAIIHDEYIEVRHNYCSTRVSQEMIASFADLYSALLARIVVELENVQDLSVYELLAHRV